MFHTSLATHHFINYIIKTTSNIIFHNRYLIQHKQQMSDWIKLVECKQTPSSVFTIYDYTKIAYPIDFGYCLREIVVQNERPQFIETDHQCDAVIAMYSLNNCLIAIEKFKQTYQVCFYTHELNEQIKLSWTIENVNNIKTAYSEGILMILGSSTTTIEKGVMDKSVMDKSVQKGAERGTEKGAEKGTEKGAEKGAEKGTEKGTEKGVKGAEKGVQKVQKVEKVEKATEKPTEKGEQLLFIDCISKKICSRGLIQNNNQEITIGPNNSLSILHYLHQKTVTLYKNQILQEGVGRIYRAQQIEVSTHAYKHLWVEGELIVWNKQSIQIIIDRKVCQQIQQFHRLHAVTPLICGFLACDGSVLKIFKKKDVKYSIVAEFSNDYLMKCENICLSLQEDILAYFCPISSSIVYSTNLTQQIQESSQLEEVRLQALKYKTINHQIAFDYAVYGSQQSWFAAVNGSTIQLYNSTDYEQFLSIKLEDVDQTDLMKQSVKIRHIAIHPNRPILAVAVRKSIKIYYVTFNEIRLLKQIQCFLCGFLSFNTSGSLLTAVVSGKMGTKIYLYKMNETKSDFALVQNLTSPKKINSITWNSLDSKLYCFHGEGYFYWSTDSHFKVRQENSMQFNFLILGGIVNKDDKVIVWGEKKAILINEEEIECTVELRDLRIKQIYSQSFFYFILEDGRLCRNKKFDIESCLEKALDLKVGSSSGNSSSNSLSNSNSNHNHNHNHNNQQQFQLLPLQSQKFIFISKTLNLKFYQIQNPKTPKILDDIISIQKKKLQTIMNKHKQYEQQIQKIKQNFISIITQLKASILSEQSKREIQYKIELNEHIERQKLMREQKYKLQQILQKNKEIEQRQTMNQVKEIERIYQRKIALTTNKLLTEQEINFRQKMTHENKLKVIEEKHYRNIEEVRKEFGEYIRKNVLDYNEVQRNMYSLKKEYETRLYDLEQQNQLLLKSFQEKNENGISTLKKSVVEWEIKYSECLSKKDNVQKQLMEEIYNIDILKQKMEFLEVRKIEAERRNEHLSSELEKIQSILAERNKLLQFHEKRIQDLEKSNEIMKYRVTELKQQNDPHELQIIELKQNLVQLQQEHEKIIKSAYESEQKIQILKKEKYKLKEDKEMYILKYNKIMKRYDEIIEKIREITKMPIQEIRKEVLLIVDNYSRKESINLGRKRVESPLGELNRIRDHLEVCLDEAVTSGKKNEEQRKIEIMKKNSENSELLKEINTLRRKLKILEGQLKQKNLYISRLIRGEVQVSVGGEMKNERATTQAHSKQFTKSRARETSYEKSLFKSGNWNEKRLKTDYGSRRKKSSNSMLREKSHHGMLAINPGNEDIEEYKRIIEQKDIFIQKLIAKIHK